MKKVIYYFGVCILIGIIISAIFSRLPVFSMVARGFLSSLALSQFDQAYSMLSPAMQHQYSLVEFETNVKQIGLEKYQSAVWQAPVVDKDKTHAYIIGIIITKQNQHIPIQFEFINAEQKDSVGRGLGWRIDAIHPPEDEVKPAQTKP